MKNRFTLLIITIALLFTSSCGQQPDSPTIPFVKGPNFNVQDGKILISLEFEALDLNYGGSLPIPSLENSELSLTPMFTGGSVALLALDPTDFKGIDAGDPVTLPGGRPFPFTADGTLPAVALTVPDFQNITFYLSDKIFGIFVPFEHRFESDISGRIRIDGKSVGIVSLLRHDSRDNNSGFLLLLSLSNIEDSDLQTLLKFSQKPRNRHKVF